MDTIKPAGACSHGMVSDRTIPAVAHPLLGVSRLIPHETTCEGPRHPTIALGSCPDRGCIAGTGEPAGRRAAAQPDPGDRDAQLVPHRALGRDPRGHRRHLEAAGRGARLQPPSLRRAVLAAGHPADRARRFRRPRGGLFAEPYARKLVKTRGKDPGPDPNVNGKLREPGFKVLHVQDVDFITHAPTFVDALHRSIPGRGQTRGTSRS